MSAYPQSIKITLELELEVPTQETHDYLIQGGTPQLGFILDLFDVFAYHTDLQVLKINKQSFADAKADWDKRIGS
jgi:hypothetical protein